eukprot:scaffold5922_cov18-Prasinocladus_malaysianus.AAC.1
MRPEAVRAGTFAIISDQETQNGHILKLGTSERNPVDVARRQSKTWSGGPYGMSPIADVQARVVEHSSRHFHKGPPLALREFESMMIVRARELPRDVA